QRVRSGTYVPPPAGPGSAGGPPPRTAGRGEPPSDRPPGRRGAGRPPLPARRGPLSTGRALAFPRGGIDPMKRLPRPWLALLLCAGVCCLAAGCGGGKGKVYKVTGTLTKGGGPLPASSASKTVPPGTEEEALGIEMLFYPF